MKHLPVIACLFAVLTVAACDVFVSPSTRMERADKAMKVGDYGRAEIELRNVLQSEPQNRAALAKLVEALVFESDLTAAETQASALRKLGPLSPEEADLIARLFLEKGDFAGLKTAMGSGEIALGDTRPLREAQLLVAERKVSEASERLAGVTQQQPANIEARLVYAQTLLATGRSTQASQELDAILRSHPNYARAWSTKGYLALASNPLEALQFFDKAMQNAGGQLTRLAQINILTTVAEQQLALDNVPAAEAASKRMNALWPELPRSVLVAAEVSSAKGEYDAAIASLQKVLARQENLDVARLQLGRALAAKGNLRQAEAELGHVLANAPANLPARKELAAVYVKLGQPLKAIEVLAPTMNGAAMDPVLIAQISEVQGLIAKSQGDRERLQAAVAADPGNEPLRLLTAGVLLRSGERRAAIDLLSDKQQFDPRRIPILFSAVAADHGAAGVRAEADRLAAAYSKDARVLVAIGLYFAGQNDPEAARRAFERALSEIDKIDPPAPPVLAAKLNIIKVLAGTNARLGDKAAAMALVTRYATAQQGEISALILQGDVKMDLKDYAGAATAYQQAFEKEPSTQTVLKLFLARRQAGAQDFMRPLDEWLQKHPADNVVRMLVAENYETGGNREGAISQYQEVLSLQPAHVQALNNLAWLYQEQGDKRAQSLARLAYEKSGRTPEVADTYGWILLNSNQAEQSLPILADAAAKSPLPEIQYHYAIALSRTGSAAEAKERLTKVLAHAGQFNSRSEAERTLAAWNKSP